MWQLSIGKMSLPKHPWTSEGFEDNVDIAWECCLLCFISEMDKFLWKPKFWKGSCSIRDFSCWNVIWILNVTRRMKIVRTRRFQLKFYESFVDNDDACHIQDWMGWWSETTEPYRICSLELDCAFVTKGTQLETSQPIMNSTTRSNSKTKQSNIAK